MPSKQDVKQELSTAFSGMTTGTGDINLTPYLDVYAAMGAALSEGMANGAIKSAFWQLEKDMIAEIKLWYGHVPRSIEYLKEQKAYFDKGFKADPKTKPAKNVDISKLLTKALAKFERAHGFTVPDKLPNYAGFVFGHVFTEGLRDGMHWKDIGAGPRHGEFTHRIQWYVLIQGGILAGANQGQEALVFKSIAPWQKGKTNLWTFLFDRAEKQSADDDFRCPEKLNAWLTGETDPDFCPLLRLFLRTRMSKRQTYDLGAYLCRKTGLSPEDVDKLTTPLPNWNPSARLVYPNQGKAVISNFAKGKEMPRPLMN